MVSSQETSKLKVNSSSHSSGHTHRNSNKIIEKIVGMDLMSNEEEDYVPLPTSKYPHNPIPQNVTNKFSRLHKDFGHLDALLQIKHHK
jgi:hypothetical protein